MNDRAENNQKSPELNNSPESSSQDQAEKKPESIRDWVQSFIQDKNHNIDEIVSSLGAAANVFIDARSGGNYFDDQVDIRGDIVGGNQEKWRTNSVKRTYIEEVAGQILNREIAKINSVYIQTPNYKSAKDILQENNLIILWGNLHFGKRTTAIDLILSLLQSENVFELDPTLEDLTKFKAESNQGYIIDQLSPETAIKLNRYSLNRLSQQLKNNQSYLVITIDKIVQLSLTELNPYIISYNDFPDPKKLLEKHLAWYQDLEFLSSQCVEIIKESSVQNLLEKNTLLPRDLDRLAELLSKSLNKELTFDEALARFGLIANQKVEAWFDEHLDLSQRTFMISLAVLNNSPYQIVNEASQSLQLIIKTPSNEEKNIIPESKLSERLKEFCADLKKDLKNTEYGQSTVELIVFKNSVFQPAVLGHIWKEYDQYRSSLLSWLNELGSHPNYEIRLKASAAVGELCKYDFGLVRERILLPWANSDQPNLQKLAALALSVPIFDGSLAPQVLKLLHHWSTLSNNPRLRWTATIAYGGYVGLRFPDIALRDLLAIAQSQDGLLFSEVIQSLISLFEIGKNIPNQYLVVLIRLQLWTEDPKKIIPNNLGLVTFWLLMSNAKVAEESNTTHIPTLLWLAKENDLCQEIIIVLIRRALNLKATRLPVLQTIHNWLELVNYDHRLYRIVGKIIYNIVVQGDQRERERIATYLKRWASEKPPHDNSAWKVLSVLKKQKHLNIRSI